MYHNKTKTFDKVSTFCIGLIFILFLCLLGTINYLDTQLIETLNKQPTTLTPTTTTTTTTQITFLRNVSFSFFQRADSVGIVSV